MSEHFVSPLTPPRSSSKADSSNLLRSPSSFQTPSTPKKKEWLLTPSTTNRKKIPTPSTSKLSTGKAATFRSVSSLGSTSKEKSLPISPAFTPKKSPKRLKAGTGDLLHKHLGGIDSLQAENGKSQFGIFLPAPSTIGTGRRLNIPSHKVQKRPPLEVLSKLNDNLLFEEDVVEEPKTPFFQVINENLVNHWHNKSFNKNYSSDEGDLEGDSETVLIKRKRLTNPFLGETSTSKDKVSSNPFDTSSNMKNQICDTHVEYINHATGKRKLVKLSPSQQRIRPRKLDFSNVKD
ncbi:uncharacterized protein PRCAT00004114001 [Priceomyces carsonii]|uniref:uncharacterized protein n=1 Tax=Priceomyces carsonii TaxID=28549 RepID=UPI002EDB9162|nr:unnamed protein product [Priceomyces carsonii]